MNLRNVAVTDSDLFLRYHWTHLSEVCGTVKFIQQKVDQGLPGLWGGAGRRESLFNGYRGPLQDDESVPEVGSGDGCTAMWMHWKYILKCCKWSISHSVYFPTIKDLWKPGWLALGILENTWQPRGHTCTAREQTGEQRTEGGAAWSVVKKLGGAPALADMKPEAPSGIQIPRSSIITWWPSSAQKDDHVSLWTFGWSDRQAVSEDDFENEPFTQGLKAHGLDGRPNVIGIF